MRQSRGRFDDHGKGKTKLVALAQIHLSQKNRKRLARDRGQIELLRLIYERGDNLPPITLIQREDGEFDIDDGRHRFLAAELAGITLIEAFII